MLLLFVELKGIFYRGVKEDHCVELGRPPIGQDRELYTWNCCGRGVGMWVMFIKNVN